MKAASCLSTYRSQFNVFNERVRVRRVKVRVRVGTVRVRVRVRVKGYG